MKFIFSLLLFMAISTNVFSQTKLITIDFLDAIDEQAVYVDTLLVYEPKTDSIIFYSDNFRGKSLKIHLDTTKSYEVFARPKFFSEQGYNEFEVIDLNMASDSVTYYIAYLLDAGRYHPIQFGTSNKSDNLSADATQRIEWVNEWIKRKKNEGHEITLRLTIERNEADTLSSSDILFEKNRKFAFRKAVQSKGALQ